LRACLKDVVRSTLAQLRRQLANLPSPREIAASVTEQLSRLGVYASSMLDHLRTEIVRALDALYASVTVRQIAFGEVEQTVQRAVHNVIDGSSAANASAVITPVTAEATLPAPATDDPARAAEVEAEVIVAPEALAPAAAPAGSPIADVAVAAAAEPPVVAPASPNAPSAEWLGETVHVTAEDAVDPAEPINQIQFSLLQESAMPPAAPADASEVPPSLQASVDSADADVTADDFVVVPLHTEDNATAAAASPQPADVLSSSLILPSISLSGQTRPGTTEPAPVADAAVSPATPASVTTPPDRMMALVAMLHDMGFTHSDEYLLAKLREAGGDVNLIIDQLYM